VTGLDHIVLAGGDVERSLEWYCGVLGLEALRVDVWRAGQVLFPSVRVDAGTIIDFFPRAEGAPEGQNLNHLCLVVEPTDLSSLGEPGPRWGARGNGTSVYINDPDGNGVELRYYDTDAAAR
jgi:catechol 2,3-dioxygenase-like lactoylglutathione lyase family enzyme